MIIAERQSLFSGELSDCGSRQDLVQVMIRIASGFGFAHFTIMAAPAANDLLAGPLVYESSIPQAFIREFDRNHYLRDCPIVLRLTDSVLPQSWRLDDPDPALRYDCPESMNALFRRYGLLSCIVFPVNSVDSTRFLMRFDGDRAHLDQVEKNELGMLMLHAFDIFDRIRRTELAVPNTLSARELEVVRWTAQGKTSIEIGQILSLSDHTINAYMTNAIRKLDCVNRTQLVAKAIRLKLIN